MLPDHPAVSQYFAHTAPASICQPLPSLCLAGISQRSTLPLYCRLSSIAFSGSCDSLSFPRSEKLSPLAGIPWNNCHLQAPAKCHNLPAVAQGRSAMAPEAASVSDAPPVDFYKLARQQFAYFSDAPDPSGRFRDEAKLAFMENAGGSQMPRVVVEAMCDYMTNSYVQLGAGYPMSTRATETVDAARTFMKTFFNGHGLGEVVLGASTSQLVAMIADCYSRVLSPEDEIVIHEAAHEANVGPWERCARRAGCPLKVWKMDRRTLAQAPLEALEAVLSPRTKVVALAHVSNLLGEITDVDAVVKLVKSKAGPDARVVVDGVAFAPHRALDVKKWGVDWYVFSTYKVCGPHMGALFGTYEAFADLKDEGPNHFWIGGQDVPYKFELGGVPHEGCAGLLAVAKYLKVLAEGTGGSGDGASVKAGENGSNAGAASSAHIPIDVLDRETIEKAFEKATEMELPLQEKLVKHLASNPKVTVIGPKVTDGMTRVPTVSFVHATKKSADVSKAVQEAGFAVRHGHMYSYRLAEALEDQLPGNSVEDGVVRVSMVHYNTPEEVDLLCKALDEIL